MILGLLGYLIEAFARLRGRPEDEGTASIGRELRELEHGLTPARPRDTAHGGAPRSDPR
jgi:hypothetical protein